MNANNVTLAGFTTSPAKLRKIGERSLVEFTLAYNRKPNKEGEPGEVDFVDVKHWGKNAPEVAKALAAKGVPLIIAGPMRQDRWDDKETGEKHSRVTVEAYIVGRQILAPKEDKK